MNFKKFLVLFMSLLLVVMTIAACAQTQRRPDVNNGTNNGNNRLNNDNNGLNNGNNRNVPEQTRVIPRRVTPMYPRGNARNFINDLDGLDAPNNTDNTNADNDLNNNRNNNRYVDRAERIADRVADLREIQSSTCVITGDTAMIGVQFSDQYKGDITNDIKDKCEEIVKDTDQDIDRVVVTADPDLYSRLQAMLSDIRRGRPLSGFTKEMNELLNRIQPK